MTALALDIPRFDGRALCAETDPEAFYPEKGGSIRAAKAVCAGCDVRLQCLSWALEHDEKFGVWGGLAERERRQLSLKTSRKTKPISHGTDGGYQAHRRRGETPCDDCQEASRLAWLNRSGGAA